jgi:hypothetical protein
VPLSLEDARRLVKLYVDNYNRVILHYTIGYIAPAGKLAGHGSAMFTDRDRKLEAARERREQVRATTRATVNHYRVAHSAVFDPVQARIRY